MPSYTGAQIVRDALREIVLIDPLEAPHAEQQADAIVVATDLIDSWRADGLTIRGRARTVYSLVSGTQNYTIGPGGTFAQDYPSAIERWGVIPDDDAADPVEHPRGRPLTFVEWSQIRVKSTDGSYPTQLYYDRRYDSSGRGTVSVYPIPDNGDVDVVLYMAMPQITSLVAATTYDLPPAMTRALKLELALELADRWGKAVTDRLERRARQAKGTFRRSNIIPRESPIRPEFVIGAQSDPFNIYNGDE